MTTSVWPPQTWFPWHANWPEGGCVAEHVESTEAVQRAYRLLSPCELCPRDCRVDRHIDEVGFCGVGSTALVGSIGPHFGEERVLVGRGGSGTIFLAGCNLGCVFCQNADLSHSQSGEPCSSDQIARYMLDLQRVGCENINFVTPTHVAPQLMEAIDLAKAWSLSLPIVWNCGGYESVQILRLLDGYVDIYMPDIKYADPGPAAQYSDAPDYPDIVRVAVREMHRQVGDLVFDNGVARRGLLVRHLVLPDDQAGSREVIDFLADHISPNTYINVMGQYRPEYQACQYQSLSRRPTQHEVASVRQYAHQQGLRLAD